MINRAEIYILTKYPHLIDLNKKNEGIIKSIDKGALFFVIKGLSEEDIHKAIKYNVWSSTNNGNKTLNEAYKSSQGNVYLFFSSKDIKKFLGLAKMKSEVDFKNKFPYWTKDNKWGGVFQIEFLFIKDVPFGKFSEISIKMTDGIMRPVALSRDTQEVPFNTANAMIQIIENYISRNNILEHFEYYDIRQMNYEINYPLYMNSSQDISLLNY